MRSVAVGEAAVEKDLDVIVVPFAPSELMDLPKRYGFETQAAGAGEGWLDSVERGDAVLFDGYGFTTGDHTAASRHGARVGAVDDFGTGRFEVDVLVNPNAMANVDYDTRPGTTVAVGPRFAMVRAAFRARRRLAPGGTARLVVVLGGSDATGLAPVVVESLRRTRTFERVVMLRGPAAPPIPTTADDAGWLEVVHDPSDVAVIFAGADAALAAAGTTTWELLTVGVPTALVQVADNQRHVMAITDQGCALSAGGVDGLASRLPSVLAQLADPAEQRRLSAAASTTVDGLGAGRVVAALTSET